MVIEAFQNQLVDAFPEQTWVGLVKGLRDGVKLADDVIATTPLLRTETGQDLRGHIRRAGILHHLQERCRLGDLPFKAQAAKMPIGCWHWLDIRSGEVVAHVIRTETSTAIPKVTANRQSQFLKNQYDLLDDGHIPPLEEVMQMAEERYSALTFGITAAGDLTHAALGMPGADGDEWLAFIDLLRSAKPQREDVAPPAPQPPDATLKLKFLKHVEDMLEADTKDKGQKSA